LRTKSAQQPVAHEAFDVHNGAHVPTPPPKSTQKALSGKPQHSPFTLQLRLFAEQVPPAFAAPPLLPALPPAPGGPPSPTR
jgi:hypothetical protein